jgi:hypothetical protein
VASGGSSAGSTGYVADGEVHILDRLAVVFRYRRIVMSVFVLTTMAMMIQD